MSCVPRKTVPRCSMLYIDRQLLHEVTSPQAFESLGQAGRKVWRASANLAVCDHNAPTTDRSRGIDDPIAPLQVDTLDANCGRVGMTYFGMNDKRHFASTSAPAANRCRDSDFGTRAQSRGGSGTPGPNALCGSRPAPRWTAA
jgi:Aconitase family (aconitate hydratase)